MIARALSGYEAKSSQWAASFGIDTGVHNGPADAFRHAFTSGLTTQQYGSAVARLTGDLNEAWGEISHNQPTSELNMDLHNNSVGRELGSMTDTEAELAAAVFKALQDGQLVSDPAFALPQYNLPSMGDLITALFQALGFESDLDPGASGILGALFDLGVGEAFASPPTSPLVIDLDGDGVELIGLGASEALFDLNVDGFAELTGWVKADDGFLAFDRDGDGVIDDNLELFGTGAGHANGFLHLTELDTNDDGMIDAADADFSALSIWRDLDGDGVTDDGELASLSHFGIASIDLAATPINETSEGNLIKFRSHVTYTDGSTTVVDDVFFGTDTRVAAKRLPEGFVWEYEALVVPVLAGYGTVASTWVALSEDTDLLTSAKALLPRLDAGDLAGFRTGFESFVLDWAGVSGVAPGSRGAYIDARHLAFLEALYGQRFNGGRNPAAVNAAALEQQFDQLVEKLAARFMAQAPVSSLVLGTVDSLDDHPLGFLLPLAEELKPDNFRLGGSRRGWRHLSLRRRRRRRCALRHRRLDAGRSPGARRRDSAPAA